MKHLSLLIPLLMFFEILTAAPAWADIYYYVNEDGVACFTDAPLTSEAIIIMKDRKKAGITGTRRHVPSHLASTGIGNKPKPGGIVAAVDRSPLSLPVRGTITSLSGLRHDPFDGTMKMHNGVDIAAPQGTPIKPAQPGTVIFSGTRPGYGNMIVLEHADGTITVYAHNLTNVKTEGEYVDQEETIALLGSTGRSTGPHLHFEAWRDGVNITSSYTGTATADTSSGNTADQIRMSIRPDGSLLLTNLN